ncbi:MAG: ABC transporter ATP-binding protein, partial [Bacteroidota bacterium]
KYIVVMLQSPIISIQDLVFGYSKKNPILKNLNLSVPQAAIYGFLGANGAGKSTTIRNILGLLNPTSGRVELFGKRMDTHRRAVLSKIGSLIEAPSIYLHLSGQDNLLLACKYRGIDSTKIGATLEMVGLSEHGKKLSKTYSTGMRQRLGLAIALLSDPELLVLDEPTSGLDPNGIKIFRDILIGLQQRGKTIFLSSHLLTEIEKIVSHVGILKDGSMVFDGTMKELNRLKDKNLIVRLVASDVQKIKDIIGESYPTNIIDNENVEIQLDNRENLPGITEQLIEKGIGIYEVNFQKNNLEELFMNITKNDS